MQVSELLLELFGRIPPLVREAVEGLDGEQLVTSPAPGANSIGWLIWHLTRVQDHHIADLLDEEQIWTTGEWARRFGLEADPSNTGYGHSESDVAAVRPETSAVLIDYHEAVAARTREFLQGLVPDDLDRVVDDSWDPPVTLGVRLVSVADDDLEHVGQAAYVRGLLTSR
jgi:uncharacterized damage-inducible protein DinB